MAKPRKNTTALDDAGIALAVGLLNDGEPVAFPTETVYGLGADATNDTAVARIFAVKDRPKFNPLIVHFTAAGDVWKHTMAGYTARALAAHFWPGPLTLVLRRSEKCGLSALVSAGLDSVAVRVPAHDGALALLRAFGRPLAAPSANRSGGISPTTAAHVSASLGRRVPLILDGGPCSVGLESTIVDATGDTPAILRPGGVSREALADTLGHAVDDASRTGGAAPKAPGLLESHYAPRAPVRLFAESPEPGEVLLGFAGTPGAALDLSPDGDLVEAAANLFAMLHSLDERNPETIAVAPIPETGPGRAINDRLRRAAAARPG